LPLPANPVWSFVSERARARPAGTSSPNRATKRTVTRSGYILFLLEKTSNIIEIMILRPETTLPVSG
jgi:hypothetical protein